MIAVAVDGARLQKVEIAVSRNAGSGLKTVNSGSGAALNDLQAMKPHVTAGFNCDPVQEERILPWYAVTICNNV
jgi:hypothetical protein